jgi:hypothetical protein
MQGANPCRPVIKFEGGITVSENLKAGDEVMIPRTGGGESKGTIIAIYGDMAKVMFPIGNSYRGKALPEGITPEEPAYKNIELSRLRLIGEQEENK